ncbi:hypothetical protein OKW36_000026 [Paraburkholderia sp. MM5482-R1]
MPQQTERRKQPKSIRMFASLNGTGGGQAWSVRNRTTLR